MDALTNKATILFKRPKDLKVFQELRRCVTRGLEEIDNAINLDPTSEAAWGSKTALLLEASKVAEMEGMIKQKALLEAEAEETGRRADELREKKRNP